MENQSDWFLKSIYDRKRISKRLIEEHIDRCPVILLADKPENYNFFLKKKFLAPKTNTLASLIIEVRRHSTLNKNEGLFFFVQKDKMLVLNETVDYVYNKYKDIDGFLYITYSKEYTFG